MAYPNFGKVKTIVVPLSENIDGITYDEYKEKYGLDLRDIFDIKILEGAVAQVSLKLKNTLYLVSLDGVITPLFLGIIDSDYFISSQILSTSENLQTYLYFKFGVDKITFAEF